MLRLIAILLVIVILQDNADLKSEPLTAPQVALEQR